MTFYDTKKRFPYVFLKGGPGKMRAKVHKFIPTLGMTQSDKKELSNQTRQVILTELKRELG